MLLTWRYRKVDNPQRVVVQNHREAVFIKKMIKRFVPHLEPADFEIEKGKEIPVNGIHSRNESEA